ncbi:hypothetical protein AB0053_27220, partial [Klebsiella pneumoniae]
MINVLIIEDEHAIRRFLRTALEADGFLQARQHIPDRD